MVSSLHSPRLVTFSDLISLPTDNFDQLEEDSLQYHTLYPVSMSYVIGGGVQLIMSHLLEL